MDASTRRTEVIAPKVEKEEPRPRQPQTLDWSGVLAQQGYVFGVDISGDNERVVLADLTGKVVGRTAITEGPGSARNPEEVVVQVRGMMYELLEEKGIKPREVLRIGVGFGGPVDARQGLVRLAHDAPGWENFPLAGRLESHFDAPTMLDNDARLAALGEVWFGAGVGCVSCDLAYIHWSTGVGGGIVNEGRLLRGVGTIAGEIGHTAVRSGPEALTCRCGGRGHLEAYVRGPALVQRARQAAPGLANQLQNPAAVFAAAEHDDSLKALVAEAVDMMAMTVANLVTSLNPRLVVIGGQVAREGTHLIPRIADAAGGYAMPVSAQEVEIVPAALGDDSTVMGAVGLALESLR